MKKELLLMSIGSLLLAGQTMAQGWPSINTSTAVSDMRIGPNLYGSNTGIFKWQTPANYLGIFTWADAKNIRIGGSLVEFQKENGASNNVFMSGKLGIGVTPGSIYELEVNGQTRSNGETHQFGNVGVYTNAPTCALDIVQGNVIPNVVKVVGLTTNALVDISSMGSTIFPPSPKTGLFINRTESSDPNTIGAEIHGQTGGIVTDAVLLSLGNITGLSSKAIGGLGGTVKGVYAKGASGLNGISYGVDAQANGQDSREAYGVKGYAWTNSNAATQVFGIYGTVAYTGTGAPSVYAGYFAGDVYATGSYLPSDRKLKKNVTGITGSLSKLMQLKPSSYQYNSDKYTGMNLPSGTRYGFIAEELESVFPLLTKKTIDPEKLDENGKLVSEAVEFKAVNYLELIPILTSAIQEQQNQIEELKQALNAQSEKITGIANAENATQQTEVYLSQNVPNPFSGTTEIKYKLPANTMNGLIGIYDMNGKELKLVELASGVSGSITINGGDLQPGMYFYTLIADGKAIDSKKMILTSK